MKRDTILCPIDFSEPSRHALQHAAAIARWYASRVVALNVYQPAHALIYALAVHGPAEAESPTADYGRIRERIREDVSRVVDREVDVVADVSSGQPPDAIASYAASAGADLIVMGTRGTSGLQHLVLGSVTEDVLRKAACPVLTVPPRVGGTARFPFKRILCATDFSAASVHALHTAASLAQDATAEVTLLHVIDDPGEYELFVARPYDVHRHGSSRDAHANEGLGQFAARAFRGLRPPSLRLAHGDPGARILTVAAEERAELIVMGVRGRNPVETMLFGSTTNAVIRKAACPVLSTRA
jgi:nucleotide-binding universal stress UspA family protein